MKPLAPLHCQGRLPDPAGPRPPGPVLILGLAAPPPHPSSHHPARTPAVGFKPAKLFTCLRRKSSSSPRHGCQRLARRAGDAQAGRWCRGRGREAAALAGGGRRGDQLPRGLAHTRAHSRRVAGVSWKGATLPRAARNLGHREHRVGIRLNTCIS